MVSPGAAPSDAIVWGLGARWLLVLGQSSQQLNKETECAWI